MLANLKRRREHVRKHFKREGQQELHEGHDHEDREGHQAEQVGRGSVQCASKIAE